MTLLPKWGNGSVFRGVSYSPFAERGFYSGMTVLFPSSVAFFSGSGQMRSLRMSLYAVPPWYHILSNPVLWPGSEPCEGDQL